MVVRDLSVSMLNLPTTVVSHPPRFSMERGSWRASRSQASCTTSWASAEFPRTRVAIANSRGRCASNSSARAPWSVIGYLSSCLPVITMTDQSGPL